MHAGVVDDDIGLAELGDRGGHCSLYVLGPAGVGAVPRHRNAQRRHVRGHGGQRLVPPRDQAHRQAGFRS
jgi:hypothetical protein